MTPATKIVGVYLMVISLIAVIVCAYDKKISKKNRVELRVPEKTLFLLSALGGSLAMYLCMLTIRHKTKHARFMVGIPIILIAQIAVLYVMFQNGMLGWQ
jgi:uncharacterized membrane protein YsdA (DUF1294 family)